MIQLKEGRCKIEMDDKQRIFCLPSKNSHCKNETLTTKCFQSELSAHIEKMKKYANLIAHIIEMKKYADKESRINKSQFFHGYAGACAQILEELKKLEE